MGKPKNKAELFEFYSENLKPLYAAIQSQNELPSEILFEIHAAMDHLSREYVYDEPEAAVVEKAYSHFKRACLDVFKLEVKKTLDHADELLQLDLSIIDNGQFEPKMRQLIHEIREEAKSARNSEGDTRADFEAKVLAFDSWQPVYEKCVRFETDFYRNSNLDWARKKTRAFSLKTLVVSTLVSFVLGLIINSLWGLITSRI